MKQRNMLWKIVFLGFVGACVALLLDTPALAQQAGKPKPVTLQATGVPASPTGYPIVTGSPGSPAAREFPNSRVLPTPTPPFSGTIMPNLIDSKPGWPPNIFPPAGAPNVLLILIDDAGYGSNSAFGGIVPTPAVDKLAKQGLRYTQIHNTALCSPTRAARSPGAITTPSAMAMLPKAPSVTRAMTRSRVPNPLTWP